MPISGAVDARVVSKILTERFETVKRLPVNEQKEATKRLLEEFNIPEHQKALLFEAAGSRTKLEEFSRLFAAQPAPGALFDLALSRSGASPATTGGIRTLYRRMADGLAARPAAGPKPAEKDTIVQALQAAGTGKFEEHYQAITGGVWSRSSAKKAVEFFKSLPKITGETTVDELVTRGLIDAKPKGWDEMNAMARYVPGRQIVIETTIETDPRNDRAFLQHKEGGKVGITHRATLVGMTGDDFLVKVDGRAEPLTVSRAVVEKYNQPQEFAGSKFDLNGVVVDYDDPYMKAKVYEGFAKLKDVIAQLDFTKAIRETPKGKILEPDSETFALQQEGVRIIHDLINMGYSHDMNAGDSAGRLAIKGNGQCYTQAAVMAGLLAPFASLLGIDVKFINGKVYRNADERGHDYPYNGGNHGWLEITYRPSMRTMITDRTWDEPSVEMDKAYSLHGDRVPRDLIAVGSDRGQPKLAQTHVDFSGKLTVRTRERLFGVAGVDGRVRHQ